MADINADIHGSRHHEGVSSEEERPFVPRPGQTDYTHIKYAPVINCLLVHDGKILLVQRNQTMRYYPGYWNGLSGFLDDERTVEEKVLYELYDEAGLTKDNIIKMTEGHIFEQPEPAYKKVWVVHPVRVDVNTEVIKSDWEAQDHQWIDPSDVQLYKVLPGFEKVVATFFPQK